MGDSKEREGSKGISDFAHGFIPGQLHSTGEELALFGNRP